MLIQIEELKKIQISKDSEISKLNDILTSKKYEISELQQTIENQKNGSREKELEKTIKEEKEKYLQKINNLEIKIYSLSEENAKIKNDIKLLELKNSKLNNTIFEEDKQMEEQIITENNVEIKYDFDDKKLIINKIINYFINPSIINQKEKEKENISNDKENELIINNNLSKELVNLRDNCSQYSLNNNSQIQDANLNKINELSQIIENYKNGNLISDNVKLQIENLNKNYLLEIENLKKNYNNELALKDNITKKHNLLEIKNKELEKKNNNMKLYIKNISIVKRELENIIFKQEQKINNLESKLNQIEILLNTKDDEIKQNANNSLKLIKLINEQQTEINKLKTSQIPTKTKSKIAKPKTRNLSSAISYNDKNREIQKTRKSHNKIRDEIFKILSFNKSSDRDKLITPNKFKKDITKTIPKKRQLLKIKLNDDSNSCSSPNVILPRFKFKSKIQSALKDGINIRSDKILTTKRESKRNLNLNEFSPINKNRLKSPKLPFITYSTKNTNRISKINLLEHEENEKKEEISSMMQKIINEI